jgi:hypothetical protein
VNSPKPPRELSIGEILNETFSLYSRNFVNYVIPFLALGLITGLSTMLINLVIGVPATPLPSNPTTQQILEWLAAYLGPLIVVSVATGLIGWIIGSMAQGISAKLTSELLEKGQADLQTSFNFAASKILSILGVSIITGVLVFMGAIALFIPGIILAIMFSLVIPTIIIENTGSLESLSRSRRLVGGRWFKTFELLLILYIAIGIASLIGESIGEPFGLVSGLVSNLIAALVQPILPIGLTLYYYSNVARIAQKQESLTRV